MQWGDNALTAPVTPEKRAVAVDRSKVDPKIVEVGEGMEAMFLDYMMKVMRQTVPKGEMDLENPATEIYRGMLDSEMAQKAAKAQGVGLADQVIAYLDSQRYTLPKPRNGSGASAAGESAANVAKIESTGGTDERIQSRK
jgi:flagellar protein FlgJ